MKDRSTVGNMLLSEGLIAGALGDWGRAKTAHEEALAVFREAGDEGGVVLCLSNLGLLALGRSRLAEAAPPLGEALRLAAKLDHKAGIHYSLLGLAGVAARGGRPERAALLWGATEAARETFGLFFSRLGRAAIGYDEEVVAVRARLG